MPTYIAHYKSPNGTAQVSGVFEFESSHRAGSKQNMHDARMCMLQAYGNEAVAWQIDSVESKKSTTCARTIRCSSISESPPSTSRKNASCADSNRIGRRDAQHDRRSKPSGALHGSADGRARYAAALQNSVR